MTFINSDSQGLVSGQLISTKTTAQLGKLLDEYNEVAVILPVLAGLLVTNRLQLRGANALIANLVIAAISRQIIHQLTQEAAVISAGANGVSAVEKPSPLATEPVYQVDEDYKIMHSVAGRIRLQVRQLQADRNFAKRLERLLLEDPIVSGVRINRAAASIVIQYTAGELSEAELGLRLLQILDEAAAPAVTTTAAATA